jgi:hypothetical protein
VKNKGVADKGKEEVYIFGIYICVGVCSMGRKAEAIVPPFFPECRKSIFSNCSCSFIPLKIRSGEIQKIFMEREIYISRINYFATLPTFIIIYSRFLSFGRFSGAEPICTQRVRS